MIEVKQLSKNYGSVLAVNSLSFTVRPGEVLGFLGPNGAGKTTTMRMLSGFITPTAGDACIYGDSVCDNPLAAKRSIPMITSTWDNPATMSSPVQFILPAPNSYTSNCFRRWNKYSNSLLKNLKISKTS